MVLLTVWNKIVIMTDIKNCGQRKGIRRMTGMGNCLHTFTYKYLQTFSQDKHRSKHTTTSINDTFRVRIS